MLKSAILPCTGREAMVRRAIRSPAFGSVQRGQEAGRMFWFMRKKFSGSYFALICCRRG
jgi:hypothetical protein